ncbi:hypothetical protein CMI45_01530 [Candidatus Pacearchaeota archaeon]|jgi:hypothetical protein|nr:hypothetical protein [Candidatus Pacearchaeota archaeon]|tara:strand:- start:998 stop:1270 length:273 start_codon:yes stop_codon:yes gene_type:complete
MKDKKKKTKSISVRKGKENKVRVNITVDKDLLNKSKKKLDMFGGKLSTLFNAYLNDFVTSMDKHYNKNSRVSEDRIKELEKRLKKLEKKG